MLRSSSACSRWGSPSLRPPGFRRQARIVLQALKEYGMILADNGSSWYISGAPHPKWSNDQLHTLRRVPGSAFEVVDASKLRGP